MRAVTVDEYGEAPAVAGVPAIPGITLEPPVTRSRPAVHGTAKR